MKDAIALISVSSANCTVKESVDNAHTAGAIGAILFSQTGTLVKKNSKKKFYFI